MHIKNHIFLFILLHASVATYSQTFPFKENNKWGIKEHDLVIVPAIYDTVLNFDKNKLVCLGCFKTKNVSTNKFIKVSSTNYYCNYLNTTSTRLVIKTSKKDTCSVFLLGKSTFKQYTENDTVFKVSVKNKKYLVRKNFKQLTFGNYHDIDLCDDPNFYVTQVLNEADVPLFGLTNTKGETIIAHEYSGIKLNPFDSLIMVCGASTRNNSEDYVFDYTGKKISSHRHHIDLATKKHILFKVFEPKEHYLEHNTETKEEKELVADEVKFYKTEEILIRIKNTWYLYNLATKEKTEFKKNVH